VIVEFERFGVRQIWVVECKRRQSRVEKAHVLTLQGVVADVGADRGFLLSESDFQSGAIAAARYSNITLSNLADLRGNAAADLNEHRWNVLLGRHAALWEWNRAFRHPHPHSHSHGGRGGMVSLVMPANRFDDFLYVTAQLGILEQAFQQSRAGAFPTPYAIHRDEGDETLLTARTMEEFLDGAARSLDEIEQILREFREELSERD
jgi:hypothetical protein